jgi:hypothetical protein
LQMGAVHKQELSNIITYMTIKKLSIMTKILTTASASLGNIYDGDTKICCLLPHAVLHSMPTTIVLLPHYASAVFDRKETTC